MRYAGMALVMAAVLAGSSLGEINVKLTADKTILQSGETTTVRLWGQGTVAGLYGLGGTIEASGPAGLLISNAGTFTWETAFHGGGYPLDPQMGTPGSNGGWSMFGSMQTNFLHPDMTYGRDDYVEVGHYTVTSQGGDGAVTLTFAAAYVSGFPAVETNGSVAIGTFTPVTIRVGLWPRPGDTNGDGEIDAMDLLILAGAWASCAQSANWNPVCDWNSDGNVNVVDLLILAENWGR